MVICGFNVSSPLLTLLYHFRWRLYIALEKIGWFLHKDHNKFVCTYIRAYVIILSETGNEVMEYMPRSLMCGVGGVVAIAVSGLMAFHRLDNWGWFLVIGLVLCGESAAIDR